jgi:hypothetical protein
MNCETDPRYCDLAQTGQNYLCPTKSRTTASSVLATKWIVACECQNLAGLHTFDGHFSFVIGRTAIDFYLDFPGDAGGALAVEVLRE